MSIKIFFEKDGSIKEVINLNYNEKNSTIPSEENIIIDISFDNYTNKFFINGKEVLGPKCNFIKCVLMYSKIWKPKSWVFSGFNPTLKSGIDYSTYDYSDYDIVISNPAFTCIKNFLNQLIISKVDFIILSDFVSRGNPRVGLHLMLNKVYLGFNIHVNIPFENWDIVKMLRYEKEIKVNVDWITSFKFAHEKRGSEEFKTGISFELYKDEYSLIKTVKMKDGTIPIRLNSYRSLPDDYHGWFVVPISCFDSITSKNFEWYGTHFVGWHNKNKQDSPFDFSFLGGKYNEKWNVKNNKSCFAQIIAKRR